MKWALPAKTFLVGEYVALTGGPAILLTTTPCFEISLSTSSDLNKIHPDSPAGKWWQLNNSGNLSLDWHDPYNSIGGLGASSAQFLGAYFAVAHLNKQTPKKAAFNQNYLDNLLEDYKSVAWNGIGTAPSGYDVVAQSMGGIVYFNKNTLHLQTYVWPFKKLAFILLHTGAKLATHNYLQTNFSLQDVRLLANIVESARDAFENVDDNNLICAINNYYTQLFKMNLVASHTVSLIDKIKNQIDVLAIKGCGALGADILLLVVPANDLSANVVTLKNCGWQVIATNADLMPL